MSEVDVMSALYTGAIADITLADRARFYERGAVDGADVRADVAALIADIRARGDAALRDMALRFDGATLDALEVPRSAWDEALAEMDADVRAALESAADAIRTFHAAQMPVDLEIETRPGVTLGRRVEPLDSVGVYAPGGRAAYPSSVLMGVVPARVAGVGQIIVCTPPSRDGRPSPVVLAACAIAGADRVFAIGGAGAVAALAFGTESVPAVARIIGPGNAYVMEAKQQVNGYVSIDSPAGPSEVLVIADSTARADLIAMELVAQAEHDPDAAAVAVIVGAPQLAQEVVDLLQRETRANERQEIIATSLARRGAVLLASSLDEALEFAEAYAPEHLALMIDEPRAALPRVRRAGTVFLGSSSSVAFGDYMTGANHVLPTSRMARSFSGLSTLDFVRFTTYQDVSAAGAAAMSEPTRVLAVAERLPGHARAAAARAGDAGVESRRIPLRSAYASIELYEPGRTPCDVDLSDNTNLHGIPPAARRVLESIDAPRVTRYPTVYARDLKDALARRHGVDRDNIVTGCGSDDILDSLMRAFCNPGDSVAFPAPTFGVVDLFARMNSAQPRAVPHGPGLQLDVDALVAAGAAVTYVCNPNNPTGTLYERASIEALERDVRGVLVIDEAYADYAGESAIDLALRSERTVVVRTMSKAFGLAGLRIGYAIGNAGLIREIEKSRGPYKVGGVAEAAALAVLESNVDWVDEHVRDIVQNRERLAKILRSDSFEPLPSRANFLLIPVPPELTASALSTELRAGGVAVRPFTGLASIGDAIRVTVGPWPLMERFVNALRGVRDRYDLTGRAS